MTDYQLKDLLAALARIEAQLEKANERLAAVEAAVYSSGNQVESAVIRY